MLQVVYNSNPALVPPQKSFVKDSEYAAQFKQYNAMPVSSDDLKAIPRAEKPRSKVRCQQTNELSPQVQIFRLKWLYCLCLDWWFDFHLSMKNEYVRIITSSML